MRFIQFLQKLSSRSVRFAPRHQSGMMFLILSAPTAQQLTSASEHLRYWPYVKAFLPIDETHLKVQVFVGRGILEKDRNFYMARSFELMNQCVRQYQAQFMMTDGINEYSFRKYHRNKFLRPDNLLKPFCDFIDEMYHQNNYKYNFNNNNLNHYTLWKQ